MKNIFIQGMRRNGTTIVFDAFAQNPELDSFYEPLAQTKPNWGGGSGARNVEYFENIRKIRADMLALTPKLKSEENFNYGAPRAPMLEFKQDWPDYIHAYLHQMVNTKKPSVIKFTRAAHKTSMLHRLDPDALFVHVVRHPARVAASHIFGKNAENKPLFGSESVFFTLCANLAGWSVPAFSNYLVRSKYRNFTAAPDFLRVLMVWKDCFEATNTHAKQIFGENYVLVRHEDITLDPEGTTRMLYEKAGLSVPQQVLEWMKKNVKPASKIFAPKSSHWEKAFALLEMEKDLELCGYTGELGKA